MNACLYYGYYIVGNEKVAIAINENDPDDSHTFTRDPGVNNNAYIRAMGWAYPGEGDEEEIPLTLERKDIGTPLIHHTETAFGYHADVEFPKKTN